MTNNDILAFLAAVGAVTDAYKDNSFIRDLKEMRDSHEAASALRIEAEGLMKAAHVETRKAQRAMADGEKTTDDARRLMHDANTRSSAVSQNEAQLELKEAKYRERVEKLEAYNDSREKKLSRLEAKLSSLSDELDKRETDVVTAQKRATEKVDALRRAIG